MVSQLGLVYGVLRTGFPVMYAGLRFRPEWRAATPVLARQQLPTISSLARKLLHVRCLTDIGELCVTLLTKLRFSQCHSTVEWVVERERW
jgi:hypothetical protein